MLCTRETWDRFDRYEMWCDFKPPARYEAMARTEISLIRSQEKIRAGFLPQLGQYTRNLVLRVHPRPVRDGHGRPGVSLLSLRLCSSTVPSAQDRNSPKIYRSPRSPR